MKKLMKMKNKKGFTLIEIIVVLVIIAILAAVSVPALLGYVEEARGKAYINEARAGMTAAQAVATEAIASGNVGKIAANGNFMQADGTTAITGTFLAGTVGTEVFDGKSIRGTTTFANMVKDVELNGGVLATFTAVIVDPDTNRVTGLTYNNGKYEIKIADGTTTVTKVTAPAGTGTT